MDFDPLLIILAIAGIALYFRLSRRLDKLESDNARMKAALTGAAPMAEPDTLDQTEPETIAGSPTAKPAAGPWQKTTTAAPIPNTPPKPPRRAPEFFVFTQNNASAFLRWIRENWFYAVSAASLGLAGIFFVQYGIENGLLPPAARVAAAAIFGLALIGAAEFIRRRSGDHEGVNTAYIPSVFAAAGIMSLNGAAYSAYALYGLISPGIGFAVMLGIALMAIVLGWFYTSALAAMGLIGAFAAPFIMGDAADVPNAGFFYGYIALVTLAGLTIDTIKRWAWVSVLALLGGLGAAFFSFSKGLGSLEYAAFLAVIAIAACTIPTRSLMPHHRGPGLTQVIRKRFAVLPDFPIRLAILAIVLTAPQMVLQLQFGEAEFWGTAAICTGLFVLIAGIWRSYSIQELALIPLGTFLALLVLSPLQNHVVVDQIPVPQSGLEQARVSWNTTLISLIGLGVLATLSATYRSLSAKPRNLFWAAVASSAAPITVVILEIWWRGPSGMSPLNWALFPAALAAGLIVIAQRFAHQDGAPGHRTALALLGTLAMWSLAATIVLTDAALVITLAATVAVATFLDKRFNLRLINLFVQAATLTVGYLLLLRAELLMEQDAGLWRVILEYLITFGLLAFALQVLVALKRHATVAVVESTLWSHFAIFCGILTFRALTDLIPPLEDQGPAIIGLVVSVLLVLMASQLYRRAKMPNLKWLRAILAGFFAGAALILLFVSTLALNPVIGFFPFVVGPPIVNSLMLAYLLPAVVLLVIARNFQLPRWLRITMNTLSAALATLYVGLAIRHFWLGPNIKESQGVHPYELYSYTVALILLGAVLIYLSISRQSNAIRIAGLAVIGLATLKVFLIDASGLDGLTRVFSFLALGLSLAGLAWLNRWSQQHINKASDA